MALIKCPDCAKEFSDQAPACPNCGRPNQAQGGNVQPNENGIPTPYNQGYRPTVTVSQSQPIKKNSGLSIAALIFSIMGCTFIVGIILSIIDLCKKDDTRKHTLSKVALVISCIWLIIGIVGSTGNDNDKTSDVAIATESSIEDVSETASVIDTPVFEESEIESSTESEATTETMSFVPEESKEEFIASCQEISYKTLARTPDEYIGQRIVLTIKISQVMQGGWFDDSEYYRVYTNDNYDMWLGDEYFMYDSRIEDNTKILKDDVWKVYAEFIGTETVTRALSGTKEDVPAIKVYYADLLSE